MVNVLAGTARYRLARHYLDKLRATNDTYRRGNESMVFALAAFDQEWSQIKHWQAWVNGRASIDDEAKSLSSAYAEAGTDLLALRQDPRERLVWLDTALVSARETGNRRAEIQHLIAMGEAHESLSAYEAAIA